MAAHALRISDQNRISVTGSTCDLPTLKYRKRKLAPQSESTEGCSSETEMEHVYCKHHDTQYCLDTEQKCLKLFSRIFVRNSPKNQAQVRKIFGPSQKEAVQVARMLKCSLCHDLLQRPILHCIDCGSKFCTNCQEDFLIESGENCLKKCPGNFTDNKNQDQDFLLDCLEFKCEQADKGCEATFSSLNDLCKHEIICDYSYTSCEYCQTKIMRKNLQSHLENSCCNVSKCDHSPECSYIGTTEQVDDHLDQDCIYEQIYCTNCSTVILRRDKDTHSCVNNLLLVQSQKEQHFAEQNSKLAKVMKENDKLRHLLETMQKTLLEKCQYEQKLKREIKGIQKEYPNIVSPRRAKQRKFSGSKRQKTGDAGSKKPIKPLDELQLLHV
ncbi:unnamed protein product [Moneuplotes crassus]|uniref:Uncharacterized protein n=1 Tax=Euplotes crassus TaxID=5936 RepID=A0AAD1UNL9_EUPCR|nr:unnamed protein product [Moneuplotes crassus]